MSLKTRLARPPNHTGPSAQRAPVHSRSIAAPPSRYALNRGSSTRRPGWVVHRLPPSRGRAGTWRSPPACALTARLGWAFTPPDHAANFGLASVERLADLGPEIEERGRGGYRPGGSGSLTMKVRPAMRPSSRRSFSLAVVFRRTAAGGMQRMRFRTACGPCEKRKRLVIGPTTPKSMRRVHIRGLGRCMGVVRSRSAVVGTGPARCDR